MSTFQYLYLQPFYLQYLLVLKGPPCSPRRVWAALIEAQPSAPGAGPVHFQTVRNVRLVPSEAQLPPGCGPVSAKLLSHAFLESLLEIASQVVQ